MKTKFNIFLLLLMPVILLASHYNNGNALKNSEHYLNKKTLTKDTSAVLGFGFLNRIVGLWNGPVFSSTPSGSFDSWHVDFRPVSASQVSQYTSLDSTSINYTSFFIVKQNNQLKVAMRTEGIARNKGCVTYEVVDSVNEAKGYYRFSDFQSGSKRAYTEFNFKKDKFVMEVYTTKFNKVNPPQLHAKWEALSGGREAAAAALSRFNFPQPVMVKDFTDAFKNMTESIYFTFENDPYPSPQPYVGTLTVNISIDKALKIKGNEEVFLLLTTEPLFEGIKYKSENLKYKSKYVSLPINKKSYTITDIHPGKYYLYSFVDTNNDKKHLKGDYMSSEPLNTLTIIQSGNTTADTKIDYLIP